MDNKQRYYKAGKFLTTIFLILLTIWGLAGKGPQTGPQNPEAIFRKLWKARALSQEEISCIRNLPSQTLQTCLSSLPRPRREASKYILEWSGLRPEINRTKEVPKQPPLLHQGNEALHIKDYRKAERLYRRHWIESREQGIYTGEQLLYIRKAAIHSGRAKLWIPLLENWNNLGSSGFEGPFFLASCFEETGSPAKADSWYVLARKGSEDTRKIRRAQWYRMRLFLKNPEKNFISFLKEESPFDNQGGYFDDLLDDYFSRLVRQKRWEKMETLVQPLLKSGLKPPFYQLIFLLERAPSSFKPSKTTQSYFGLHSDDPRSYFTLRSAPRLWPMGLTENSRTLTGQKGTSKALPGQKERDEFYTILLEAGYMDEALALWKKQKPPLSMTTILAYTKQLAEQDRLYEMIGFTGYWYYHLPPSSTGPLIPLVYPGRKRYHLPVLQDNKKKIPRELILGIIRRESAFKEDIASKAGAVGLMQLMPSTAEDLARKKGIANWSLTNPRDNILLGTLYLDWLRQRHWTSSWIEVLASYNGGGGNLRRWKQGKQNWNPELLIQSIPYRETRNYIRQVIVATAYYRYLETTKPPGAWIDQFYHPFLF